MTSFLEIHEISSADDYQFYKGDKRELNYKIKNASVWPVRDIRFEAYTIDPDGNRTENNYVTKLGEHPVKLMPKDEFNLSVHVNIPESYNDQYIIKSGNFKGESVLCPIDIHLIAYGTEIISRISI